MAVLLNFLSKNSKLILFFILEILALFFTFNRNFYHESWIENKIISFSGYVDEQISSVNQYFNLKEQNNQLLIENTRLKNLYFGKTPYLKPEFKYFLDSSKYRQKYYFSEANVISNSITLANNYLILDKGSNQGIIKDMGVVSPVGVVGFVISTSPNYSKVMSILNQNAKLNVRLKTSKYFGTLTWDGDDTRIMKLSGIPKYVGAKIGDTIETDGKSLRIPEGIPVGRISNITIDSETGNWDISAELFQKMGNIQKVYVIKSLDKVEIIKLQKDSINAK